MEDAIPEKKSENKRLLLQIALFAATFFTTTIAGANLCYSRDLLILKSEIFPWFGINENFTWEDFRLGLNFSVPLLFILSVHEFGHYFTARYHRVSVSLPYYIPLPLLNIIPNFGTFGAVIRLRSRVESNIKHFDIGLAGPLAGFVATVFVLGYGFATLPPPEYIFQFHPDYKVFGLAYAEQVYTEEYLREASRGGGVLMFVLGDNILFNFMAGLIADPARIPNPYEIIHYPALVVGFIALFFTTLNLLPIGQLDGGHVVYGLFGRKKHSIIATISFVLLVFYSGLGIANFHSDSRDDLVQTFFYMFLVNFLALRGLRQGTKETVMYALLMFAAQFLPTVSFPTIKGDSLWLAFSIMIGMFVGVHHPPSDIEQPLDRKRIILGWVCLAIFVISFSPKPFVAEVVGVDLQRLQQEQEMERPEQITQQ